MDKRTIMVLSSGIINQNLLLSIYYVSELHRNTIHNYANNSNSLMPIIKIVTFRLRSNSKSKKKKFKIKIKIKIWYAIVHNMRH